MVPGKLLSSAVPNGNEMEGKIFQKVKGGREMYKSVVVIATIDRPWTHQYRTSVGDGGSGNYGRRKGDC